MSGAAAQGGGGGGGSSRRRCEVVFSDDYTVAFDDNEGVVAVVNKDDGDEGLPSLQRPRRQCTTAVAAVATVLSIRTGGRFVYPAVLADYLTGLPIWCIPARLSPTLLDLVQLSLTRFISPQLSQQRPVNSGSGSLISGAGCGVVQVAYRFRVKPGRLSQPVNSPSQLSESTRSTSRREDLVKINVTFILLFF
ncbi:hypothetical protein Hanom_Chr14g01250321 [Helianthus anomalus]